MPKSRGRAQPPRKAPGPKKAQVTKAAPAKKAPVKAAPAPAAPEPVAKVVGPPPSPAPVEARPPGLRGVLRVRTRRVDFAVAGLLLVLGFALVVQVRSTRTTGPLTNARQEDLVQILDELGNRSARLRQEIDGLTATREQLTSGSGASAAALAEATRRTKVLGVLAGTLPAAGPGVVITIKDPETKVSASVLLDALEELRNAGAEAVQLSGADTGPVRVVAQTALADDPEGVVVDGTLLRAPYRFTVVGDPGTLAGALGIPGGIEDVVGQQGGSVDIDRPARVTVGALRVLSTPRYARPR
jgi:uncharacterized protein YlxW (UPF0749 family)